MFKLETFMAAVKLDNPTFERVKTSDLHALVAQVTKSIAADKVAAEMRKITPDKWKKYARSRKYLIDNVPGLKDLMAARLVNFKTKSLAALSGGNIKHDAVWESDSGKLADLAHIKVREAVSWGTPAGPAIPYLDPAYAHAGHHFGVGNAVSSPGTVGNMSDTHDAKGAWGPTILNFAGPGKISYTCDQVYQYTDDNGASWHDIPNSTYQIVRTVSAIAGNKIKFEILKKSVPPNGRSESRANKVELSKG